jgi:hypothetical protein
VARAKIGASDAMKSPTAAVASVFAHPLPVVVAGTCALRKISGVTSSFHFALATCSALLDGGRRQNRRAKDNRSARTAGKIGPERNA